MSRMTVVTMAIVLVGLGCSQRELADASTSAGKGAGRGLSLVAPALEVGSVGGRTFTIADAVWTFERAKGFGLAGPALFIEVSDFQGDCSVWASQQGVPNGQTLVLGLATRDQNGKIAPANATGRYLIGQTLLGLPRQQIAAAYYQGGCSKQSPYHATSGEIDVTAISSSGIDGTFDVTLSCAPFASCRTTTQSRLTGSFHALPCASLDVNKTLDCAAPSNPRPSPTGAQPY